MAWGAGGGGGGDAQVGLGLHPGERLGLAERDCPR